MNTFDKKNIRYNILTLLIYIFGMIIIFKLFYLQIINGEKYLEESNSRLTRETTIKASRGNIKDCNGVVLAGTKIKYSLEIYKSKISNEKLNDTILNTINVLENNGDSYVDDFPISIDPFMYQYTDEDKINKWLQENKIQNNLSAKQVIEIFIKEYGLENYSINEARKIIGVRYGIEKKGYTSMRPYIISKDISQKSMLEFEEKSSSFPGISAQPTPIREYLYNNLASHVLGYVGKISETEYEKLKKYSISDYIGKNGIEYSFEEYLKGTDGLKQTDMSIEGTITGEYITKEAISGADVTLTLDAKIQETAEKTLKEVIEKIRNGAYGTKYNAKTGGAVVMKVDTGEVLAMCSYPDFEPQLFIDGISIDKWNEYTNEETSALLNRTIQSTYAPGSVYKMVTAIAGLESGVIKKDELIYDIGVYKYGGSSWKCWIYSDYGRGHGYLNVSGAIQHSCNYFFYETAKRMGIDTLEEYARYFGLGSKTGIELIGEEGGILACKSTSKEFNKTWYGGDTLNAAIGQGDNSFTPLQIAKYISMLTNGGNKIDVTLIKSIIGTDNVEISKDKINTYIRERFGIEEENAKELNIQKETLNVVLDGMRSVTTETGGTAYSVFKDFSIEVGGKTGSAEAGKNVNAWFVGFAPYDKPEIAVVVFVENGGHGYYTANVAKAVFEKYFGTNEQIDENRDAISYLEGNN